MRRCYREPSSRGAQTTSTIRDAQGKPSLTSDLGADVLNSEDAHTP